MKTFLTRTAVAAVAAMAISSAASAATVTIDVLGSSQDGSVPTNTANLYAANYGAFTPVGATWLSGVSIFTGSSSTARSPWDETTGPDLEDVNSYFAVGPANGSQPNPAILEYGSSQRIFTMLWGSVDSYNTLTFGLAGGGTVNVLGATVASAIGTPPCDGSPANFACTALLRFTVDEDFNSVSFFSDGQQAFEFALLPVPLPAAGWLLLAGIGGLAMMARRKKA